MNKKTHEPIIHLVKRVEVNQKQAWGIRIGAFLLSILVCAIMSTILSGRSMGFFFTNFFKGIFGTERTVWNLLHETAIILLIALAVTPCFKMKFWNIGAEGQITMGAVFATYFALFWSDKIPHGLLLIIMALSGAIAGGLWAVIPAFFKAKWNTNETLFTLMMNYIAIGIVAWLQGGPWEGRKGSQLIPMFSDSARLPTVFGVNCGWIIVLVLVVLMYIYMNKTKQGYEIAVIGDSVNTARYAGMNVGWIIVRTMFISGAISGVVGFIIVSGANFTLYSGVADGVGFTSITVAWLSQLNSFAMIAISMILAILEKGSNTLQTRMEVPASIADIITGILLFCMLSCEFFINYRLIFRHKEKKEVTA